ncbi:2Fe-2S iron-sulfur cluster-binding protein [Agarilytica rhodophyticola]|uniref:2Fe-2S iron-sulfur cluster-binding protein n=1 Tax=Agarilytica rhodophyticola TaxID=1737490 RepID=UPI000B346D43|nr:2Fe-2S iron-sulfur cluster-binding protein [Agarilytica rhodophyticola]
MAKITFITDENQEITVEGHDGSIMALAVKHSIPGIDGDCGGVCSCATCHVQVLPEYFSKVGEGQEIEKDMLELDEKTTKFSRLCCQIEISEQLDGVTFKIPS